MPATRWRVDFRVKSDMVLAKDQSEVVFTAPDDSHEIHLFTRRGAGKHAADELYLATHVILHDEDPMRAADRAADYLRAFLNVLSVVTSSYYRVEERTLVADWTLRVSHRRFLYFKRFPNPNVPIYGLEQAHLASAMKLMSNQIPGAVLLAIRWWARGVGATPSSDQFQYFWYALEIFAEFTKPTAKVPDKCPSCGGELFCQRCETVPVHRPYPKQAIRELILKHVKGEPEKAFELWDKARNALLHGTDPKEIQGALGFSWQWLSDSLGKAVWAAFLAYLVNLVAASASERGSLALAEANTYAHFEMTVTSDMAMGAAHKDPDSPKIEEFQPDFKLEMNVQEQPDPPTDARDEAPREGA